MSHLIRFLVFLAIAVLVSGCKVAIIVVEGGEVGSDGSNTCEEGTICIVAVNDTNFSETFTAVPNPGWHFVKWNSGEGFFCGDSTNPTCVLSAVEFDGNEGIEAIIASDQTFYIMPIFRPEPDTVTVDGKEWAQVDQFTNLSWNDINAVCPAGVCSGVLNGYDMTGWTWASVDDVIALFNHYIGNDELGPAPDRINDCVGVDRFFRDGWRSFPIRDLGSTIGEELEGLSWGGVDADEVYFPEAFRFNGMDVCYFVTGGGGFDNLKKATRATSVGGWFWRPV